MPELTTYPDVGPDPLSLALRTRVELVYCHPSEQVVQHSIGFFLAHQNALEASHG